MQADKKITIAVDGYSSCGKSTLAKALAKRLGYVFIDTGAMYRGITLYCMRKQLIRNSKPDTNMIEKELPEISLTFAYNPVTESNDLLLNGENVEKQIRMPDVAANVSKIAAIKSVRHKLVDEQRKIGENGGIVMDGRDIGSVVFPEAELKLFVTATPEIRAKRRLIEQSAYSNRRCHSHRYIPLYARRAVRSCLSLCGGCSIQSRINCYILNEFYINLTNYL